MNLEWLDWSSTSYKRSYSHLRLQRTCMAMTWFQWRDSWTPKLEERKKKSHNWEKNNILMDGWMDVWLDGWIDEWINFIDTSTTGKYDLYPLINGLSDHDAQLFILNKGQKKEKECHTCIKREIKKYTRFHNRLKIWPNIQGSSVEIRTPKQWNLIGPSEIYHPPVLSPSNTLPPSYSHCALIHARKNSARHYFNFPPFLCVGLKLRKLGSVLFSSVTHSRTSSTYILPSGETPNFTPISHKWKNYSSVQITVSVLDIKPEVKILNGILRCNLRMKSALYCFVHVANKSYVFLLYLCIHPLS